MALAARRKKDQPLGGGTMLGYAPILDREFTMKLKKAGRGK